MLNSEKLCINESYTLPVENRLVAGQKTSQNVASQTGDLYLVKETEKIYVLLESLLPQICPVIALNKNGFLFQYVDTGDSKLYSKTLDILKSGEGVLIDGLEIVSLSHVESGISATSEFTTIRHCYAEIVAPDFQKKTQMEFLVRRIC